MLEARHPYDGQPPRPWISLELKSHRGRSVKIKAVVDTRSPFHLMVHHRIFRRCRLGRAPSVITNFGVLEAAWSDVNVPGLAYSKRLLIYGSDQVADAVARSSRKFTALVGLPFLRMFEYGGNQAVFWLRLAAIEAAS